MDNTSDWNTEKSIFISKYYTEKLTVLCIFLLYLFYSCLFSTFVLNLQKYILREAKREMVSLEFIFLPFFKPEFWEFCCWLCLVYLSLELLSCSTNVWCLHFIRVSGTLVVYGAAVKTKTFFLFLISSDQTVPITQNHLRDKMCYLGQAYGITVPLAGILSVPLEQALPLCTGRNHSVSFCQALNSWTSVC